MKSSKTQIPKYIQNVTQHSNEYKTNKILHAFVLNNSHNIKLDFLKINKSISKTNPFKLTSKNQNIKKGHKIYTLCMIQQIKTQRQIN